MRSYATETDIIESILHLNKKVGIDDVSRKILVMCESYVFYYLKNYSPHVSHRKSTLMFLKLLKLHPFTRKDPFIAYQITGPYLSSVTSAKFLEILYITVFKVFVKHLIFLLKIDSRSIKTGIQSWQP